MPGIKATPVKDRILSSILIDDNGLLGMAKI